MKKLTMPAIFLNAVYHSLVVFILALSMIGCQKSTENNKSLEFDQLNVNFGGALSARSWDVGDEIGIYSSCTRNDETNVPMSASSNTKYVARIGNEMVYFDKASDNDVIIANATDHNFRFYAYYPYSAANADRAAIGAQVPAKQTYSLGVENYGLYVASKQVTTIVPTVDLDFKGIFSVVQLFLPNDLFNDEGNSFVRSLTLRPTKKENFTGVLADGGVYNLETGVFTSNVNMQADSVEIDFGEAGVLMADAFTEVSLAVSPFTVPLDGLDVVISDLSGNTKVINILSEEEDQGTILAAGEVLTQYLTKDNDGIIPVSFPVVFPLGKTNGVGNFLPAAQPRWVSEGIWTCPTQTQAYAQWNKASDPSTTTSQFLETVNSGEISSPGVKGIWTGDNLEFVLPVKKFAAGTAVTVKLPMYTRFGPVFWDIEYLDGTEWKSNKTNITSYDPAYSREATFSLIRGGKIIEHMMVFTKAIESGYVKIRIKCADGSVVSATDTEAAVLDMPHTSGAGKYDAPFYFYLAGSDVTSVTFSIN